MAGVTILAAAVFVVIWLVSMAGLLIPVIPGVPLAAVGALLAAWMVGFKGLSLWPLVIIAALAVLAQVLDMLGSWLGAKYYGASTAGMWGGIIGSVVGVFVLPPFGFLPGALVGAVVFELLGQRSFSEAFRSGLGALLGALGGTFMKVLILIAIAIIALVKLFS
jgi:uncharacterized protein YqgC (DUF456 family)